MICMILRQSKTKERNQPYHTAFHGTEQANGICNELNEKKKDLQDGEEYKVIGLYEE